MPADLQKARELFLHAVGKLPPEQWDGYVGEACGGDVELERQVGQLLQVHREAGSFLDRPAAAVGATGAFTPLPGEEAVAVRERPGTVIGPYKLLQQIGEGGMGTVFMAEQTHPVQRKVALKVIKPGMDSQQVIARFEAERQALAMMDHVNIARVFDAGSTEAGLPYFVMELVHGVPITKYCDDNHLTPRERLELFVPVCQAIQHAHQKGIIHRDIKPSNVMVTLYDGKPVPKVIDFGVAKATEQRLTERTLFTQYGSMVGTPQYMSPEQAEMSALGADTRSDIFSLGVLLYELLTGSTPLSQKRLKEAAYGEVLRMIREEEPPRPSTRLSDSGAALASISAQRHTEPAKLAKLMRGELDWIVMKCLEKDRNRRYETANGFAADVQRYLNDEAVLACPPSAWYRFRKFARRHKGPVLAAGLVALALLGGVVGTTLALMEARRQRTVALAERDRAEVAERRAIAEAAVARAVAEFLTQDLLGQADVASQPAAGRDPDVKVRTLLDRAAKNIEGKFPDKPFLESAIQRVIGETYQGLGLYSKARRHLERSVQMRTSELGADHPETLRTRHSLALVYKDQGKFAEAEALLGTILQAWIRQQGANHRDTLINKIALGRVYFDQGKYAEAETTLKDVLQALAVNSGADPTAALGAKHTLALVCMSQAKHAEAERLFQEVIRGFTARFGVDHKEALIGRTGLGLLYIRQGKYADAQRLLKETLALLTATLGADHPDSLNCKHNLAMVSSPAESERLYKEIIQTRTATQGAAHPDTLKGKKNLALVYMQKGKYAEAEALLKEVIEAETATLGVNHAETLRSKYFLAKVCVRLEKYAEAGRLYTDAIQGWTAGLGANHPDTIASKNELAWLLATCPDVRLRDPGRAVTLAREVVQQVSSEGGFWNTLGITLYRADKWPQSIAALEKAMALRKGGDSSDWFFLAMARWQLGQKEEAGKWYDQAVQWMEKNAPKNEVLGCFRAEAEKLLKIEKKALPK